MKVNYFFVTGEVHGRPITEVASSDIEGLKGPFSPKYITDNMHLAFIDIVLEDASPNIDENEEANRLRDIIDIPKDTMEEIITDQRPRADSYSDFYLILLKCLTVSELKGEKKKRISEVIEGESGLEGRVYKFRDKKKFGLRGRKKERVSDYLVKIGQNELVLTIGGVESVINEYQIGLIVKNNMVFAIHREIPGLPIETVFSRFTRDELKLAAGGITFFVMTYIDLIIDNIYSVIDKWASSIDKFEHAIINNPQRELLSVIITLKHKFLDLVKILQAEREILGALRNRQEFKKEYIPPELDDHIRHMIDETDILRNVLTNLTDLYFSSESSILNEIMKRYTFISSLILLPSLIAGIFGMNNISGDFNQFMTVIMIMLISVVVLFTYFKYKKYI